MYRFKINESGKIDCLLRTGFDLVKTEMTETQAEEILNSRKVVKSDLKGYGIATDDGWYFKGAVEKKGGKNA